MVAFLYIASLIIAAACVSVLGAAFSVSGLARLFSGAAMAVALMASALEFSKFVAAAFLHRTWKQLNKIFRTYLFIAVVVLSLITSMGIFGFLSDAYQTSSVDLTSNTIKIEAMKGEEQRNKDELARINHGIEEIPASRITKKLLARKEAEPRIQWLTQRSDQIAEQIKQLELKTLDVKQKVGPLIYVARAFNQDVDTVVKWLILVFVSVFDPLAICLVVATGEAIKLHQMGQLAGTVFSKKYVVQPAKVIVQPEPVVAEAPPVPEPEPIYQPEPVAAAEPAPEPASVAESSPQLDDIKKAIEDEIQMRYVDDPDQADKKVG